MTFFVVCGGTAGHINPGLSIADKIKERDGRARIIFIGAGRDMEKKLIPAAGYELINIKMSGVRRSISPGAILHNIRTVRNVISARAQVNKIIKKHSPSAVIGTGGYICYPVLKAAAKAKIPAYIHESNATPGMTVKMLSSVVDKVFVTYEGYEEQYKHPGRIVITGTPVRKEFDALASSEKPENTYSRLSDKPLVVSFWGSLGAERMNEMMEGFIKKNLQEKSFYHIHATGAGKDPADIVPQPPYADIRRYIEDMPQVLGAADLVLCRAGGLTLAELTAAAKPAILIPSAFVPDNVQHKNAQQLLKSGAAVILDEAKCTADVLYNTVKTLVSDNIKLRNMSEAAGKLRIPDAAGKIVDIIMSDLPEINRG